MCIKACEHYKKFGLPTDICMSENPWNAWVKVYDFSGELCYNSFETGLFTEYVEHLLENPDCAEEVGYDLDTLREIAKSIEEAWQAKT